VTYCNIPGADAAAAAVAGEDGARQRARTQFNGCACRMLIKLRFEKERRHRAETRLDNSVFLSCDVKTQRRAVTQCRSMYEAVSSV